MTGAVIGGLGVSLFVAGAAFREILGDSRSAKCCVFPYKMRLSHGTASSKRRVRDDDFIFGLCSDILGSWSNHLYIGGSNSGFR